MVIIQIIFNTTNYELTKEQMLINHFKKLTVIYDIILLLQPNIVHQTRINQLLVSHQIVEQSARSDIYWLFDHHQLRKLLGSSIFVNTFPVCGDSAGV